jgi:hypothetical protein
MTCVLLVSIDVRLPGARLVVRGRPFDFRIEVLLNDQ